MSFADGFVRGLVLSLTLTSPPLYRYPYRNSMEAFRSDWKHIGGDVESAFQTFEGASGKGEFDE
jgi:hypothetical protein